MSVSHPGRQRERERVNVSVSHPGHQSSQVGEDEGSHLNLTNHDEPSGQTFSLKENLLTSVLSSLLL